MLRAFLVLLLAGLFGAHAPAAQDTRVPQQSINEAVDRGVDWLLLQQRRDGSWGEEDFVPKGHRDPRSDLTAFCAYTLLKCRVPYDHPALQRALVYLEQGRPRTTYAIANEIMLLVATGEERWTGRTESLLEDLLALRHEGHGTWGYPGHPSIQTDLSNTQYAVLALRAAANAGHKVPKKLWSEVAERVLVHQEAPQPAEPGEGRGSKPQRAGFAYLLPNPASPSFGYNVPNASMTTAGLTVLRVADEQLGSKLPGRLKKQVKEAVELGFRWLEDHFSVTSNVKGEESWIYYYLYGLQRLGALYEVETIGAHEWYWEGAAELVKWQLEDGHWEKGSYREWPRQPMPHANTGYALLFLVKAMAPITTGTSEGRGVYSAEEPASPVHLRVAVRSEVSAWVSGFGEGVDEGKSTETPEGRAVDTPGGRGLAVREVRYFVDGALAATVPGDVEQPWNGQRFARKLALKSNGRFAVRVEVSLASDAEDVVLTSATVSVEVNDVLEPWMMEHAALEGEDVRRDVTIRAEASSEQGKWTTASRAIDGLEGTRWLCKADDARPLLRLTLRRPTWVNTVVLSQADSSPVELGRHPRVVRVALRMNGSKQTSETELELDPLRPTWIELPKRVRLSELEIQVLEIVPGREFTTEAGFAEVHLLDRR